MSRDGEKDDLTRLEDLGHFEHLNDPEVDKLLGDLPPVPVEEDETPPAVSLDELPDETPKEEALQETPAEEITTETTLETSSTDFSSFNSEDVQFQAPETSEETPSETSPETSSDAPSDFVSTDFALSEDARTETEISFTPSSENIVFQAETSEEEKPESSFSETPDEEPVAFTAAQELPPPSTTPRKRPEDFQDIKNFGQSISYGKVSAGGNPPFSLILKGIRYQEDAKEILDLLDEHGLLSESSDDPIRKGIEHGAVLISQISEYAAIYMAHKLRRFNIDIQVGLSEELHNSKSYESDLRGMIQRENLLQNHAEHLDLEESSATLENIIMATTPTIQGYKIGHYVEILTEQITIDEDELGQAEHDVEKTEVFPELVRRLKEKALKLKCNGILGVNFQFLPLPAGSQGQKAKYKIICTGNAVILSNQ